MRILEIRAYDDRILRQAHKSVADAKKSLIQGYEVVGEIVGEGVVGDGLSLRPPLPDDLPSYGVVEALLHRFGAEIMKWLTDNGVQIVKNVTPTKISKTPSDKKTSE